MNTELAYRADDKVRISFLGSSNLDLIADNFRSGYSKITGGVAEVAPVQFGQYRSQVLDEKSPLRNVGVDFYVFCERFEDFADNPFSTYGSLRREAFCAKFDEYLNLLRTARSLLSGAFLVLDLAPVGPLADTLDDASYEQNSIRGFVLAMNARLSQTCQALPDCHLVRLSTIVEAFGSQNAMPGKYWHLGRMAYSPQFSGPITDRLTKMILNLRRMTARVLVLDLDNTLWGGIIGEDGIKGIKLGGDFPGCIYTEIQKCVHTLKERGLILSVCSRNTESVAVEAIKNHPEMILRFADFVSVKINWEDKADNIRRISEEIGVSLSAVCFLDDSPQEREAIRRLLPQVIVPDLPQDVALWPGYLMSYPYLSSLYLTDEDLERTQRYQDRSRFLQEAASFSNREDYWQSLNMSLHFYKLSDHNLQRVLQLLAKTNQFNMTTRRYTELDLERLESDGARIMPIGLADKFSAVEIIGVVILLLPKDKSYPAVIESFLLSCRVLGRSVETGVLGFLSAYAVNAGYKQIQGVFVATERNLPASNVYRHHGFTESSPGCFVLDIKSKPVAIPEWFKIRED